MCLSSWTSRIVLDVYATVEAKIGVVVIQLGLALCVAGASLLDLGVQMST